MSGNSNHLRRQQTGELELGITEATQAHTRRKIVRAPPASADRLAFERRRPRWLREMAAEATGVFFYVFPGVGATASQLLAVVQAASPNSTEPNAAVFGSTLGTAFAFGLGISFAIITSASVSGGHFNPAITVCFTIYQGFPVRKAMRYILAQVIGAFIAGLLVYGMYYQQFVAAIAGGATPESLIGILCAYPQENQGIGYLVLIEYFVDSFIALVIWAVLDPANPFVSPAGAPFAIGLAYTTMIIAFSSLTISTNLARDLGTRIVAAIFLSGSAFTYKSYCWIGILLNVPATVLAVTFYEFAYKETQTHIEQGHLSHPEDVIATDAQAGRRESDATFAGTRLGRFLSNRNSICIEDHKEDQPEVVG